MRLRNLKLKYQLFILIGIGVAMMVLVQIVYYVSFDSINRSKAEVYASNIINLAHEKLNETASSIKNAATSAAYNTTMQSYLTNEDISSQREKQISEKNLLLNTADSNAAIGDIGVVDRKESVLTARGQISYDIYSQLKQKYGLPNVDQPFYTPVIRLNTNQTSNQFVCYVEPIFNLSKNSKSYERIGTCLVLIRLYYLQSIVENTSITPNSLFMLVDNNGTVVVSNKPGLGGSKAPPSLLDSALRASTSGLDEKIEYNGSLSMVKMRWNKDLDWRTISITPIDELTADLEPVRIRGIAIGAVTVLLLGLAGFLFSRSITRPIARIVESVGKIGDKNLKQRIGIREKNEIGVIAGDINQMLDKIENLTDSLLSMQKKLYEMELSKKETALSALQSQINPHFLYNTLECIRSIGTVYKVNDIANIATAMAKIFRYSIRGGNFTTVREEVECIRDYLSIVTIRFQGKISAGIDVAEGIMDISMVKMILQPIVENAVYHGLEPKEEDGTLCIRAFVAGNRIVFEVKDNGIGINEEETLRINRRLEDNEPADNADRERRSIGLFNIQNRLRLYYGPEYGIRICSRINEGTTVFMEIPLEGNENIKAAG